MNLYKKILRLEKRIKTLEQENLNLCQLNADAERLKQEYAVKVKSAEEKESEYSRIIEELRKKRETYQRIIHRLEHVISKANTNSKKAITEIKNDLHL